jgi:hypothetical protein
LGKQLLATTASLGGSFEFVRFLVNADSDGAGSVSERARGAVWQGDDANGCD